MTNLIKPIAFFMVIAVTLSSCGAIIGGSRYNGHIAVKEHPNADIFVNGNKIGTGVAQGSFKRNHPLTVEVRQFGCEPKTQTFDNVYRAGPLVGNILVFGGLLGIIIDAASGACYKPDAKHDPQHIHKVDYKNFDLIVDYSGCQATQ